MKVKDITTQDVYCAAPTDNLVDISTMMRRHGVGAMPVCDGKKLVGILTDRDIAIGCVGSGLSADKCTARDIMNSNPISVTPDTELEVAAETMGKYQIHRLPVVEDGRLVGIISLGDISVALAGRDKVVTETLRRISMPGPESPSCF